MEEVMTWAEIEEAFDGEWVLIEDPEMTPMHQIAGGKVIFHSRDRKDVHEEMQALPQLHHAILYIGDPPEDLEYAL